MAPDSAARARGAAYVQRRCLVQLQPEPDYRLHLSSNAVLRIALLSV